MDVKLIAFKPNGERVDVPVTQSVTTIGRGETCEIRLPVPSVSRNHCQINVSGDEVTVKDLGSANGTYVNNNRITETKINPGDRISIGPIPLVFQIDGQPEQIEPPKPPEKEKESARVETSEPEDIPIELEAADVEDATGMSPEDALSSLQPEGEKGKQVDPISALEQLASQSDKKKKKS